MAVDVKKSLKKYVPHLLKAQEDNLNEADTVQRLIKVFEEVFGYDLMTEISREAHMKNKYVDIALKIDGTIKLLVEVKAAGETLRDRHIEQAQNYASNNNYRWVLLTNGVVWNLYHLTFEEGIESEQVFSVDLSEEEHFSASAERLSIIHKLSIKKGELEQYWERSTALGPKQIHKALFNEQILGLIRREIRRQSGVLIDIEDLAAAIYAMLTQEAQVQIGPMKVIKRKVKKAAKSVDTEAVNGEPGAGTPDPATGG